ncbi:hypothetical protein QLX08_007120 [Tetragonisca angustula]|uniref:Uncharacterized protein n=1 Tax=Tetragonisca angustula TaxID=166442 RepID=A0AAW0ZR57_9HYME
MAKANSRCLSWGVGFRRNNILPLSACEMRKPPPPSLPPPPLPPPSPPPPPPPPPPPQSPCSDAVDIRHPSASRHQKQRLLGFALPHITTNHPQNNRLYTCILR